MWNRRDSVKAVSAWPRWGAALLLIMPLVACQERMANQPRFKPFKQSVLNPDQTSGFMPVPGTLAMGQLEKLELLPKPGKDGYPAGFPFPIRARDIERAKSRYLIYCAPCHGSTGRGDGEVVRRGFFPAPDYRDQGLLDQQPSYFVDVMTRGKGQMASYAAQVGIEDRWRIAAYIKQLQSQK